MSNQYLEATKRAITKHGSSCTFVSVVDGTYNVNTGSVTNSENNSNIIAYKKHIKATQYYYPELINKDIALFYVAASSFSSPPKINDAITFSSVKYRISEIKEHSALGQVCLYVLLGIKQ